MPGRFLVLGSDDDAVISPENAERYAPFVAVIDNLDTDQVVALYLRYYPLLQEAYAGLGKDDDRFNDRVVEILDLLAWLLEQQDGTIYGGTVQRSQADHENFVQDVIDHLIPRFFEHSPR